MREKMTFKDSMIINSQIDGSDNQMFIISGEASDWKEIEQIFEKALEHNADSKNKELAKQALELSQNRDKKGLSELVKKYFSEFTKSILVGVAADAVLKFLL